MSFSKQIRNFIICLATVVAGISYSGFATPVIANVGVVSELVITSPETADFPSTYFINQNFPGVKPSSEFREHCFSKLLKNYNCRTAVSFELNQEITQNLKSLLLQQIIVQNLAITTELPKSIS